MKTIHDLIENYLENEDKSILLKILDELKTTDHLWTVLVRVTNNFYLGIENEKPAAYLFTEKEYADNFTREIKWGGIQAKCLEIAPEQRITFFSDLYRSGFEAVAIDKGEDSLVMSLFGIIDKPQESEAAIMNPPLMRAANQFYQELSRKRAVKPMQDLMCRVIFQSEFLVPVEAAEGAEGRHLIKKAAKMSYATLTAPEGKKYLPIFTDWNEFAKYDKKKQHDAVLIGFGDFKKMLKKVDGISLNPFGFNLIMDPMKIASIEGVCESSENKSGSEDKIISLKDRRDK